MPGLHHHLFKLPSSAGQSIPNANPMTRMGRSLLMEETEETSLFSLMIPSFNYQANPQRPRPYSTGVSVVKPRRRDSAPSQSGTSSASSTAKPTSELVPILRRRSSSQLSAAREGESATRQTGVTTAMAHSASESSDLPSLTSSSSSDSLMMEDDPETSPSSSRHFHDDPRPCRRAVSFCPQVWVRVFERSQRERDCIWYSPRDMEAFKVEALERIQQYYSCCHQKGEQSLLPTGAGRVIS
jgi:hypothetical protein